MVAMMRFPCKLRENTEQQTCQLQVRFAAPQNATRRRAVPVFRIRTLIFVGGRGIVRPYDAVVAVRPEASTSDENALGAPNPYTGSHAMVKRRRFKQSKSLKDRLASFAKAIRDKASDLPPGR